ncbi:hypothetical protein [Saccharicrinis fermentans]
MASPVFMLVKDGVQEQQKEWLN